MNDAVTIFVDGVTSRMIDDLPETERDAFDRWLWSGSLEDHEISPAGIASMAPLDTGSFNRNQISMVTGSFTMPGVSIRGACIVMAGTQPETILTSAIECDAAEVLGWERLRGLPIIDAENWIGTSSVDSTTMFRLEARLECRLFQAMRG